MKLLELKGEKALDVLADLLDPIQVIASDQIFRKELQTNRIAGIKYLLKNHKPEVIKILAIANEQDPETYEPNILELPSTIMEFLSDPTVSQLFGLQDQTTEKTSSGPVMENTEASEM